MASNSDPSSFFIPDRKPRIGQGGNFIQPKRGGTLAVVRLLEHVVNGRKRFGTLIFSDGSMTPEFPINPANPSWIATQALNYKRWCWGLAQADKSPGESQSSQRP
jgi:hypothetical protein